MKKPKISNRLSIPRMYLGGLRISARRMMKS